MPPMCDHAADGSEKGDTTIDDGTVQDRSLRWMKDCDSPLEPVLNVLNFESTRLLDEQRLVEHLYARSSTGPVESTYRRVLLCDAGLQWQELAGSSVRHSPLHLTAVGAKTQSRRVIIVKAKDITREIVVRSREIGIDLLRPGGQLCERITTTTKASRDLDEKFPRQRLGRAATWRRITRDDDEIEPRPKREIRHDRDDIYTRTTTTLRRPG
ncbi:unnamed protein product [Trichogramma brassicae]|uniref:Uncharacterized protein n=1 Tax=Trichogramma brassicae TaxID=86971 RepID=A0A6H5J0X0_9HYME|nr:unnamed protein product [Trichogramma brassicae]